MGHNLLFVGIGLLVLCGAAVVAYAVGALAMWGAVLVGMRVDSADRPTYPFDYIGLGAGILGCLTLLLMFLWLMGNASVELWHVIVTRVS